MCEKNAENVNYAPFEILCAMQASIRRPQLDLRQRESLSPVAAGGNRSRAEVAAKL